MIGVSANSIRVPTKIPNVNVVPMKAPTCPLCSYSTVPGAFTAQSVDKYPLVNAKHAMFKIMNQSEIKSQLGPISNAIITMVARKMTLEAVKIFTALQEMSNLWYPAIFLPTVSQTENIVFMNRMYQLIEFCSPSKSFK